MAVGEYIEREAALQALCEAVHAKSGNIPCRNQLVSCSWAGTRVQEYAEKILAIPAADVVPVVHGHWIKSPECPEEYDICSVCGKNDKHRSRGNWEHDVVESVPPFCKWCGARMNLVTDRNQVKDGDGE